MVNLFNKLLPNDRVHAILADIRNRIKPTPVVDKVIEVDVAPMKILLSTDSITVFRFLYFSFFFFHLLFLSLKYVII